MAKRGSGSARRKAPFRKEKKRKEDNYSSVPSVPSSGSSSVPPSVSFVSGSVSNRSSTNVWFSSKSTISKETSDIGEKGEKGEKRLERGGPEKGTERGTERGGERGREGGEKEIERNFGEVHREISGEMKMTLKKKAMTFLWKYFPEILGDYQVFGNKLREERGERGERREEKERNKEEVWEKGKKMESDSFYLTFSLSFSLFFQGDWDCFSKFGASFSLSKRIKGNFFL